MSNSNLITLGALALPFLLDETAKAAGGVVVPETHSEGFAVGAQTLGTVDMGAFYRKMRDLYKNMAGVGVDVFGMPACSPNQLAGWVALQLRACDAAKFDLGSNPIFESLARNGIAIGALSPAEDTLTPFGRAYFAVLRTRRETAVFSGNDSDGDSFIPLAWATLRHRMLLQLSTLATEFDSVGGVILPSFADSLVDSVEALPGRAADVVSAGAAAAGGALLSALGNLAFSSPVLIAGAAYLWWRHVR